MIEIGTRIHVVERRLFEGDLRRHFVGEVTDVGPTVLIARGYAFVFDPNRDRWERLPDQRSRVVPLVDGRLLVRILPSTVDVAQVRYEVRERRLVVTDGDALELDVSEFGVRR